MSIQLFLAPVEYVIKLSEKTRGILKELKIVFIGDLVQKNALELMEAGCSFSAVDRMQSNLISKELSLGMTLDPAIKQQLRYAHQRRIDEPAKETSENLTYNERQVIKLLYGLGDGHSYSLEEAARILTVTSGSVSNVELRALRKLMRLFCNEEPFKELAKKYLD